MLGIIALNLLFSEFLTISNYDVCFLSLMKTTLLIFIVAFVLRIFNFEHGLGYHPDERGVQMITDSINFTNLNPKNYHYGSFSYYLCWLSSQVLALFDKSFDSYDSRFIIGRIYAALFGSATTAVLYRLTLFVTKCRKTSIFSSLFLAFNIMHLQLSRFYTVDIILTFFSLLALYSAVRILYDKRFNSLYALSLGLAFTNKISSLSLLVPYFISLLCLLYREKSFKVVSKLVFKTLCITLLTVLVVEPFLFLDFKGFVQDNKTQINMVSGSWVPPYTLQYLKTVPYLYHLKQIFYYTLGLPLSIFTLIGFLAFSNTAVVKKNFSFLIILSWVIAVFITIGATQVKFPRYFLPIYPVLMVFAAYSFFSLSYLKKLAPLAILLVFVQCLSWMNIYTKPHVYKIASNWMLENIEENKTLAFFHWDDRLPVSLPSIRGKKYNSIEVPIYEPDSDVNIEKKITLLNKADYLVLPTTKVLNAIPTNQDRFPFSSKLISYILEENSSFKLIYSKKIYPYFDFLHFNDDLADESISLYDHPKVLIFKNQKNIKLKKEIIEKLNINTAQDIERMKEI